MKTSETSLRKSDFIMRPWVDLFLWSCPFGIGRKGEGIWIRFDLSWFISVLGILNFTWNELACKTFDLTWPHIFPAWQHMEKLGNAGGHMDTQPPPTTSNLTQTTTFAQREAFVYCFNLDVGSSAWPEGFCSPSCVYFCECFEQYFPHLSTNFDMYLYIYIYYKIFFHAW